MKWNSDISHGLIVRAPSCWEGFISKRVGENGREKAVLILILRPCR